MSSNRDFDEGEETRIQSPDFSQINAEVDRRISSESQHDKVGGQLLGLIEDTIKKYFKDLSETRLKNIGLIPEHNKHLIDHELRVRAIEQKLKELIVRITHDEKAFTDHRRKWAKNIVASQEFFGHIFLLIVGVVIIVVGIFILLIKVFKLL